MFYSRIFNIETFKFQKKYQCASSYKKIRKKNKNFTFIKWYNIFLKKISQEIHQIEFQRDHQSIFELTKHLRKSASTFHNESLSEQVSSDSFKK